MTYKTPPKPDSVPNWVKLLRPGVLLALALLLTLVAFGRPLIRGDGLAYLAWIDTLVLDQDVNLNNQHDLLREVNTYQIEWDPNQERWVNIFPFGIAFVQAPFYAAGEFFAAQGWLDTNPDYFRGMQGVSQAHSLWLMTGAFVMALVMALLAWRVARRLCDPWTAALLTYAGFIGTPIFYYSTISPLHSHNPSAFALAVFLYALARGTGAFLADDVDDEYTRTHPGWWVMMGIAAGLTILCRWQLAVAVAPAWILLLYQRQWRGFFIGGVAAALTLLPLPLIWQSMFGVPFLVPYDAVNDHTFMNPRSYAPEVLLETVLHSPLIGFSLLGIGALWQSGQRHSRQWALLALVMIGGQLLVNGAALDWDSGETWGMRRMSELYALYVILLAALAVGVMAWVGRYGRVLVRGFAVVMIAYSFFYIFVHMNYTWTNPDLIFQARPQVMIDHVVNQAHRWQITWEVYHTHAGPLSWSMPGP